MDKFVPIPEQNGPLVCWQCTQQSDFESAVDKASAGLISNIPQDWKNGLSWPLGPLSLIDVLICDSCRARTAIVFDADSSLVGFVPAGSRSDVERNLTRPLLASVLNNDAFDANASIPDCIWRIIASFAIPDPGSFIPETRNVAQLDRTKTYFSGPVSDVEAGEVISNTNLSEAYKYCRWCDERSQYWVGPTSVLNDSDKEMNSRDQHRVLVEWFCGDCGTGMYVCYKWKNTFIPGRDHISHIFGGRKDCLLKDGS